MIVLQSDYCRLVIKGAVKLKWQSTRISRLPIASEFEGAIRNRVLSPSCRRARKEEIVIANCKSVTIL